MNNFESPTNQELPPESGNESKNQNEQLGGKESERRNLFERIYKSKTARILAFAATLGIGAKLLFEKQEEFNQPSTHYELGENNRLDLGELEKKFLSKTEIPNTENRYVLHIAQTHGDSNLDESIRLMKMIDKVVNYTNAGDSLERLSKVYNFVTSSNKSKSLNNLRKALLVRSVDQLVDLDNVKTSTLGQFMLRKD